MPLAVFSGVERIKRMRIERVDRRDPGDVINRRLLATSAAGRATSTSIDWPPFVARAHRTGRYRRWHPERRSVVQGEGIVQPDLPELADHESARSAYGERDPERVRGVAPRYQRANPGRVDV